MKALQVRRNIARFGAARLLSAVAPTTAAIAAPLDYRTIDDPPSPGEGWYRVNTRLAGICGSDVSLLDGGASSYFTDWVSFPFVPGHEVVGEIADDSGDAQFAAGTRVVLEPVLGHAARGWPLPHRDALPGDGDDYAHLATPSTDGSVERGIQTGFCCSTGGGWAPWLWAHRSQLRRIPDEMPDAQAVLVEPFAGAIHAALLAIPVVADVSTPVVAVIGAGTMGLGAIAGVRRYVPGARIIVGARYPHQQRLAAAFGADVVVADDALDRAVRREVGCHLIGDPVHGALSSGAHVTIDAVGSSASIADSLRITRPRGRVVLLGMPSLVSLDLTALWHREIDLRGAYTYGTERLADGTITSSFDLALDSVAALGAERLVSATYRLADHADALAHAGYAGARGAIKICFDPRET